jgi:hypothetical protein
MQTSVLTASLRLYDANGPGGETTRRAKVTRGLIDEGSECLAPSFRLYRAAVLA